MPRLRTNRAPAQTDEHCIPEVGAVAPRPLAPLPPESFSDFTDCTPVVSILCATYNQVGFIDDAISGFLAQRTQFPFEVIVRDDASTDGTTQKLLKWAENYPNVVFPIVERANTWDQVKPMSPMLAAARGHLIATCEGDDFWFDEWHLHRVASKLLSDHSVSIAQDAAISVEHGLIAARYKIGEGGTRSWVFRKSCVVNDGSELYEHLISAGDQFLQARLLASGKSVFCPGFSAVHRLHDAGVWTSLLRTSPEQIVIDKVTSWYWIYRYFVSQGNHRFASRYFAEMVAIILSVSPRNGIVSLSSGVIRVGVNWLRSRLQHLWS